MFDRLLNIADKLGLIAAVKDNLVRDYDPAAEKLADVLEELAKTYGTIDSELLKYLSLSFEPEAREGNQRMVLLELEGGLVKMRMAQARGHCHKITNIYNRYLTTWFDRVLTSNEAHQMADVFQCLGDADRWMLGAMDEVGDWLSREAAETLTFLEVGQVDEADRRVRRARRELLPSRRAMLNAMCGLYELQAEFVSVSGAVD